jgi:hypothetical protein
MGMDIVPEDIPRWAWDAARDLYRRMQEIDGEAMDAGQIAQDPEADEWTWCRRVAEVVAAHAAAEDRPCLS